MAAQVSASGHPGVRGGLFRVGRGGSLVSETTPRIDRPKCERSAMGHGMERPPAFEDHVDLPCRRLLAGVAEQKGGRRKLGRKHRSVERIIHRDLAGKALRHEKRRSGGGGDEKRA